MSTGTRHVARNTLRDSPCPGQPAASAVTSQQGSAAFAESNRGSHNGVRLGVHGRGINVRSRSARLGAISLQRTVPTSLEKDRRPISERLSQRAGKFATTRTRSQPIVIEPDSHRDNRAESATARIAINGLSPRRKSASDGHRTARRRLRGKRPCFADFSRSRNEHNRHYRTLLAGRFLVRARLNRTRHHRIDPPQRSSAAIAREPFRTAIWLAWS